MLLSSTWILLLPLVFGYSDGIHHPTHTERHISFWQLTDVHFDYLYNETGDPKEMCHPPLNKTADTEQKIYPYGRYACESPWALVELAIKGMAEKNLNPDFILWTGDNTAHFENRHDALDWSVVFSSLKKVGRMLQETFPKTAIIPVLGNHDSYLPNQYPTEEKDFYQRYLTEGGFETLLTQQESASFKKCGFYSTHSSMLKILVLNTNLYNIPDNYTEGDPDPCGQFEWLEKELKSAEAHGIKVLITAHIPPGFYERWITSPFFEHEKNDRYVNLMQHHGSSIMAQIYGHTHSDSFRIFKDKSTHKVQSVAFSAPSLTPLNFDGGVNPGIRLYHGMHDHSSIQDYWQYYLNISAEKPNDASTVLQFQLLYQATEFYQLTDLGPESMGKLYWKLSENSSLFEKYYYHNTVGNMPKKCNESCVQDHLCAISHMRVTEMDLCRTGVNLYLEPMGTDYSTGLTAAFTVIAFLLIIFGIFGVKLYRGSRSQMELPLISRDEFFIN